MYTFPPALPEAPPSPAGPPPPPGSPYTEESPPSSPVPLLTSNKAALPQPEGNSAESKTLNAAAAAADAAAAPAAPAEAPAAAAATAPAGAVAPDLILPASVMLSELATPSPQVSLPAATLAAAPEAALLPSASSQATELSPSVSSPTPAPASSENDTLNEPKAGLAGSLGSLIQLTSDNNLTAAQSNATFASNASQTVTQDGLLYDLRPEATTGPCQTIWQLIQLSPNLTVWAAIVEVKQSCRIAINSNINAGA